MPFQECDRHEVRIRRKPKCQMLFGFGVSEKPIRGEREKRRFDAHFVEIRDHF
jgi:hypothetical protein